MRLLLTLTLSEAKEQVILGFVDTYLRLDEAEEDMYRSELQKLAPTEKEKLMELTMSWKEAAEQKGLQQGLQEGFGGGTAAREAVARLSDHPPA